MFHTAPTSTASRHTPTFQGRVQEAHPGEAHQGHQGGQLEYDRSEHSEGRIGEGQEMCRWRSEPHSYIGLVA